MPQSEHEDRERDQRDGRDRPQELDDADRRALERPRAPIATPERDADHDRECEALDVALERRSELARERARRHAVDERPERRRRRRDAVGEIEHAHGRLGGEDRREHEEPAGWIRPPRNAVCATHLHGLSREARADTTSSARSRETSKAKTLGLPKSGVVTPVRHVRCHCPADWRTDWRTRREVPANRHVHVGLENRFGL